MKSPLVFVTSKLLILVVLIPPIWADFKDFIIENEQDLKRFGLADDMEEHYEDDLDSDWMPDSCGGAAAGELGYSNYLDNEEGVYDSSQIDPRLMREIVQQMKNDPRFEHLWEHLSEGNIFTDRQISSDNDDDADGESSDFYVDLDENFQGGDNYEIE